jgi:4-hydroxy-3-methylbut-2-enyl diphosphate reductase IspH
VQGIDSIGITAGASTPGWLMDQVIERLEKIEPSA